MVDQDLLLQDPKSVTDVTSNSDSTAQRPSSARHPNQSPFWYLPNDDRADQRGFSALAADMFG